MMDLNVWILFLCLGYFNFYESNAQSVKKTISEVFQNPLVPGDGITIHGKRRSRHQVAQIRLFAAPGSCPGSRPTDQCNPLILTIKKRGSENLALRAYYYNRAKRSRPTVPIEETQQLVTVNDADKLEIYIEIGEEDFKIYMDNEEEPSYTINNVLGVTSIEKMRVYSAYNYKEPIISRDASLRADQLINSPSCGTRNVMVDEHRNILRIVGGITADPGQYPWQISIRKKAQYARYGHHCGGTLIHPCWILTAAHCVSRTMVMYCDMYEIRVGDYYNGDNKAFVDELTAQGRFGEDEQAFDIDEIHAHENYTTIPSAQNDIALIKLKQINGQCARMSDFVQCACLPEPEIDIPRSTPCWVSGWGAMNWTDYINNYPQVLRHGKVEILDKEWCRTTYGSVNDVWKVREGMFCSNGNGVDTCQGDSGGPLVCPIQRPDSEEKFVIWGLTSWGEGCGDRNKPGVYTKVKDFMPWIQSTMRKTRTQRHKCIPFLRKKK